MKRDFGADVRLIGAVISGATVFPLLALRASPDPLGGTFFAVGGANSAVIPFVLGHVLAWPAVQKLRRSESPRSSLAFLAGFALCMVPALFYACAAPWWTASAPIMSLSFLGAICGAVVGTCAAVYFRRS